MVCRLVCVVLVCVTVVTSVSRRSEQWDSHLAHLHSKRQTQCNWQSKVEHPQCTLTDVTGSDFHKRRIKAPLATPQSQGDCGSCWAFAATHTYTDRLSMMTGGHPLLSSLYPTSCYHDTIFVGGGGNGCCGGSIAAGFLFFYDTGAVTDTCAPYDPLLEYKYNNKRGATNAPIDDVCPSTCNDGAPFSPGDLRIRDARVLTTTAQVIDELKNGPVAALIQLSGNFLKLYRCGVFCRENDALLENKYHVVEIVDYGTEDGVNFWVIKNSWGTDWGEGGYFRVKQGDLDKKQYMVPVMSGERVEPVGISSPPGGVFSCSPSEISDPDEDELVMSAVDHTVDEINENKSIPCPDGSPASSVALNSINSATTQVVDGIIIIAELTVDILGCGDTACADVYAVVLMNNDTFNLTNCTYEYIYNSGGTALTTNIITMATVAMTIVVLF